MGLSRVVLVAIGSLTALGASFDEGVRWPHGARITVWIENVNVPEEQREMVRRAFRVWEGASGAAFTFRETDAFPPAGIRVRFVNDDENFGETMPYLDTRTREIVKADVLVNRDIAGDPLQKKMVVYLTALHEIGHALGLGHTDRWGCIMYKFQRSTDPPRVFVGYRQKLRSEADIGTDRASGLADDDRRALRRLYPP
ncbi:MAG: matrixin family metalloprotease [Vicinamibacteria bacterium]